MPPFSSHDKYRPAKDIDEKDIDDVEIGPAAPVKEFDADGGGIQYFFGKNRPIGSLVPEYLEELL
jgi:hypothetical protein